MKQNHINVFPLLLKCFIFRINDVEEIFLFALISSRFKVRKSQMEFFANAPFNKLSKSEKVSTTKKKK